MPSNIAIAAFIFGAILILIAILGGNFKLFGSEISNSVSNRWLRLISFGLGAALLVLTLSTPTPAPAPIQTQAPISSPTQTQTSELSPIQTQTPISSPTQTPTPTPSQSLGANGEMGCVITVTHAFATFSESPSHSAREIGRVEQGKYTVLGNRLVSWGGRDEMWYQITYSGKLGWINDNPILIGEKTKDCP